VASPTCIEFWTHADIPFHQGLQSVRQCALKSQRTLSLASSTNMCSVKRETSCHCDACSNIAQNLGVKGGGEGGGGRGPHGKASLQASTSRNARRVRRAMKSSADSQYSWRTAYTTSASSMGCPRTRRLPSFLSIAIWVTRCARSPYEAAKRIKLSALVPVGILPVNIRSALVPVDTAVRNLGYQV